MSEEWQNKLDVVDIADPDAFISVIIPHYNDLENLDKCLGFLNSQTLPRARYEIIVADNNSRCGLAEVERVAGCRAKVVLATIQGAGPARNAGVAIAKGNTFAFIDSDCFASPDWLEEGVRALSKADYIGGQVKTSVRDADNPSMAEAFDIVFAFNFEKYITEQKFSGTGNLFVPRKIFEAVGLFRSGVSEDVDWGHRANALGYKVAYAPKAIVTHPARISLHEQLVKMRRMMRERYELSRAAPNGSLRWLGWAIAVAGSPFVHSFLVLRSPKLRGIRPKLKGVAALFLIRWYRFLQMLIVMTN